MRAERQVTFDPNQEFPVKGSLLHGKRLKRLFEKNKRLFQYEAWTNKESQTHPERHVFSNLSTKLEEIIFFRQTCKEEKNYRERTKKASILNGKIDELENMIDEHKNDYMRWAIQEQYPSIEERFTTNTIDLSNTSFLTSSRQYPSFVVGNISLMLHKETSQNIPEDSKLDKKIYPVLLHAIRMMRFEHLAAIKTAPTHKLVRELMILREKWLELNTAKNPMAIDFSSKKAINQEKERLEVLINYKLNELSRHIHKERDLHVVAVKRHSDDTVLKTYKNVDLSQALQKQAANPSSDILNELSGALKGEKSTNIKTDVDKEMSKVINRVLKHSDNQEVKESIKTVLILRECLSRVDNNNMLSRRQKDVVRKQYREEIKLNLNHLKEISTLIKAAAPKTDKITRGLGIFKRAKKPTDVAEDVPDIKQEPKR